MAPTPEEFLAAVDSFTGKVEKSGLVSRDELENVRTKMVADLRSDGKTAAGGLQTAQVGATKILVPNAANLSALNLSSERARTRFSDFKLKFLDRAQVDALRDVDALPGDPGQFIRHSRRLARHAREFLARIEELEPELSDEVQATLAQIEDADMDLLKLEVKSFTRFRETLVRGVAGRKKRSEVVDEFETFDLNKNQWNLSLLEHPKATVRDLLAQASERAAARVTEKVSEIPKVATVLVAPEPNAITKATPASRTASVAWRLFSHQDLDDRFQKLNASRTGSPTTWRGLGLDFNTKEWYLPVPPEILVGVTQLARARRAAMIEQLEEQAL